MDSWKISTRDFGGAVWRPLLKVRVLSDKDLEESQSAGNFLGLHNPDMALLCYRQRTFVKIGPAAPDLDKTLKVDANMNIECPTCGAVHNLHYDGEGWATLSAPL
jgi:hypothetical protein